MNKNNPTQERDDVANAELAITNILRAHMRDGKRFDQALEGPIRLMITTLGRKYPGDYELDYDPCTGFATLIKHPS